MLGKANKPLPSDNPLFDSYVQIAKGLVAELSAFCLLDGQLRVRGLRGAINPSETVTHVEDLQWNGVAPRVPTLICVRAGQWLTAIPLEQTDGTLLGAFCVQQSLTYGPAQLNRHASDIARRLKPLLDCMYRELAASLPSRERVQTLTQQTAELEWLFRVTSQLKEASGDQCAIKELLAAATQHLDSAMGVLEIPDKQICVEYASEAIASDGGWNSRETLRGVWRQTRQNLLSWAQRRNQPLVVNSVGRSGGKIPRCKIISVPVPRDSGRVIGYLAFYNPPFAGDFSSRHVYLARHLGRQAATVVDSQFDLMTGLYTRAALGQAYTALEMAADGAAGSVVYVDVDHMHVINEAHGFELGNELIVRVADLLTRPLLPQAALSARLSGDRFAIVLPETDVRGAAEVAEKVRAAAKALRIGPVENSVDTSISCGIAALIAMPQGLERAIAAAEIACKTAKSRGRDRVELYASDDHSMMQRHADAITVGRLRAALKSDRLLLYAHRIKPLKNPALPGGYSVTLRLREEDGSIGSLAPLLSAAQRYQLLPSVDRWVVRNLLQMLAPYRSLLQNSGFWVELNVAGQSIADTAFVDQFCEQLSAARLPAECLMVTLGEQAAAKNFAVASRMVQRLRTLGCQFGLDGFGAGAHALDYIKNLQISRVEIGADLVRGAAGSGNSKSAVREIVELAAGLSMETVADGVDSEGSAQLLRELRVDFARGSAFGEPELLADLLNNLGADESQRLRRLYLEM
ncbi:MAG: EAL domain-containing protein [Steroidobacteraceae bacterium]